MVAGTPGGAVLDTSALLALIHGEPGAGVVRAGIPRSVISSVNWSEVVQKAVRAGLPVDEKREELLSVGLRILSFDREDAEATAELWPQARNVSFADRACLALGRRLRVPVLTGDRDWAALDLGVEIRLIR
jgi:ribonuclease VapC